MKTKDPQNITSKDVIALLKLAGVPHINAYNAVTNARGGEEAELWEWARTGAGAGNIPAFVGKED